MITIETSKDRKSLNHGPFLFSITSWIEKQTPEIFHRYLLTLDNIIFTGLVLEHDCRLWSNSIRMFGNVWFFEWWMKHYFFLLIFLFLFTLCDPSSLFFCAIWFAFIYFHTWNRKTKHTWTIFFLFFSPFCANDWSPAAFFAVDLFYTFVDFCLLWRFERIVFGYFECGASILLVC